MSVSTDGQLCYGILCGEDIEFPWDDQQYDGDIDLWWATICGFLYDQEYLDFLTNHPLPVELVNYCSAGYPMYILAVPLSGISARRGYPTEIDLTTLTVTEKERDDLSSFVRTYLTLEDVSMKWYLSSYWDD